MRDPSKTHLEEPCDICGDVGFDNLISTCSECNIAREHVYCMRVYRRTVPEVWICEACQSSNDIVSPKSGMKEPFPKARIVHSDATYSVGPGKPPDDSGRQACFRTKKNFQTSKVKFISPEEAVMLASGAKKVEPPFKSRKKAHVAPAREYVCNEQRMDALTPAKAVKTCNTKAEKKTNKASCASLSSMHCPPIISSGGNICADAEPRNSDVEVRNLPKAVKKTNKASRASLSSMHCPPIISPGGNICADAEPRNSDVEVRNLPKAEKKTNKASCASLSSMHCPPIISSGGSIGANAEPRNSDVEVRNLPKVLPELENYLPNPPALDATWKGNFKVLDNVPPGELYDGFRAHLPAKVHRKAYKFSKQMPAVLQFKMLPRGNLWAELFLDYCPVGDDIALYFFPGDFERSKQNYVSLLEYMERRDLVMRSYMDGVELLIFTSKQLHVDSQRITMRYFLWGVFHRVKNNKSVYKEHKQLSSLVSSLEHAHDDHATEDNSEVMDMEIDMIGGVNVGRVDIAVSKQSFRGAYESSWEETAHKITLQKSDGKIPDVSRNFGYSIQQQDSPSGFTRKVKSEFAFELPSQSRLRNFSNAVEKSDIPPGFDEIYSVKVESNSCKATNREEKPLLVDGKVINPTKKENEGFEKGSGRVFGAYGLQPQKPMEHSHSPGLAMKHHQVPGRGQTTDPMGAYPPSLSEKETGCGLAMKAKGTDNGRLVEMEKKGFIDDSYRSPISCSKCVVPKKENHDYLQLVTVEVKTEVQKFESEKLDSIRELGNTQSTKNNLPVDCDFSELSLSRPEYTRDGQRWNATISKERLALIKTVAPDMYS